VYLHPVRLDEWPGEPEIVDRVPVRSCVRRGAAIDLILARGRENRSQIVYTTARGRDVVFWQSPRTRKQARPNVRTPTARAAALPDLAMTVDSHERYAYKFAGKPVTVVRAALRCGDYGIEHDGQLIASVERKTMADLVSSLTTGKLRFAVAELSGIPHAAVVVEDRYSQVFAQQHVRSAVVADGLAELQVRYPNVPVVFCESRKLAEEWTYRFLAAAHVWHEGARDTPTPAVAPEETTSAIGPGDLEPARPSAAEVRMWARLNGIEVSDRGRIRPDVMAAWRRAHENG
jgi:hypothetical protein